MTIVDSAVAYSANPQSRFFQPTLDAQNAAINEKTGTLVGCAVTQHGVGALSVDVTAGTIISLNLIQPFAGGTVAIAAGSTYNRVDLVVITAAGALAVRQGTPDVANPREPTLTAGDNMLAQAFVPALTSVILTAFITDRRFFVPWPKFANVMDFGAKGDAPTSGLLGGTDDSTAFQAAIDTHLNVIIPAGRFYRIAAQLILHNDSVIWGAGAVLVITTSAIAAFYVSNVALTPGTVAIHDLTVRAAYGSGTGFTPITTGVFGFWSVLTRGNVLDNVTFIDMLHAVYDDRGSNSRYEIWSESQVQKAGNIILTDDYDNAPGINAFHSFGHEVFNFNIWNGGAGVNSPAIYAYRQVALIIRDMNSYSLYDGGGGCDGIILEGDCEGVQILNCIITKANKGIILRTGADGWGVGEALISGGNIAQAQTVGIDLINANNTLIQSVIMDGALGVAISIGTGTIYTTVELCTLQDQAVDGIVAQANAGHFYIRKNVFIPGNGADSHPGLYAVRVVAGTSDEYEITGNDMSMGQNGVPGRLNGYIADGGSGVHKTIKGNYGVPDDINVPFAAGNYTANAGGTWVVTSGAQVTFCYEIDGAGRMMTVWGYWNATTITGSPTALYLKIPANAVAAKAMANSLGIFLDGAGAAQTGFISTSVGSNLFSILKTNQGVIAAGASCYLSFMTRFEIQ